jgi:hypothetical protein
MKIIYSHWQASNHKFCDKEMAIMSNNSVKKLGYKTCLYTDQIGYDLLSDVDYDEIIIFDKLLLSKFNKKIWSLGKMLTMSLTQEPFIHLDFDLFLFQKLDNDIITKDSFCLYSEPWITEYILRFTEKAAKLKNIKITNSLSRNFSIVGGKNFKALNSVCSKLIGIAISNYNTIERMNFNTLWDGAVLFEQVLIPQLLLEDHDIKIHTIFPDHNYSEDLYEKELYDKLVKQDLIDNFVKNKIVHLHGNKMNKFNVLKPYLT